LSNKTRLFELTSSTSNTMGSNLSVANAAPAILMVQLAHLLPPVAAAPAASRVASFGVLPVVGGFPIVDENPVVDEYPVVGEYNTPATTPPVPAAYDYAHDSHDAHDAHDAHNLSKRHVWQTWEIHEDGAISKGSATIPSPAEPPRIVIENSNANTVAQDANLEATAEMIRNMGEPHLQFVDTPEGKILKQVPQGPAPAPAPMPATPQPQPQQQQQQGWQAVSQPIIVQHPPQVQVQPSYVPPPASLHTPPVAPTVESHWSPHQMAPQQMAPQQWAPQQMAPQQMAPQQMAPQQWAPQQIAPQQWAPQQWAPQQWASPQQAAPVAAPYNQWAPQQQQAPPYNPALGAPAPVQNVWPAGGNSGFSGDFGHGGGFGGGSGFDGKAGEGSPAKSGKGDKNKSAHKDAGDEEEYPEEESGGDEDYPTEDGDKKGKGTAGKGQKNGWVGFEWEDEGDQTRPKSKKLPWVGFEWEDEGEVAEEDYPENGWGMGSGGWVQ
jgi:hypothetical protein